MQHFHSEILKSMKDPTREREQQHQGDVCLVVPQTPLSKQEGVEIRLPPVADLRSLLNDHVHQVLLLVDLDRETVVILASEGFKHQNLKKGLWS